MKLYSLLKNLNCRVLGSMNLEISGLYHCDTEVKENGLFFCLHGTKVNGVNYVYSAVKNGAVAIVSEQELPNLSRITQIIVKDAREFMSLLACRFYGNPASKLKIIGVTGTNGKTTITNMIKFVLDAKGKKCAVIGTNGIEFLGKKFNTGMTTPDPIDLQKYLAMMVHAKVEYVCMEVSAHAIHLNKIAGMRFESAVFTNLSEDHLDYFKTMENYFAAKTKFFSKKYTNYAVVCVDDEFGKRLNASINFSHETYAINAEADYTLKGFKQHGEVSSFKVSSGEKVSLKMAGRFNALNATASMLVLNHLGISKTDSAKILSEMEPVSGRFNVYGVQGKLAVIDYAHTPDGLEKVISACREIAYGKKVISVFGCGGNRETQKRQIMGEISSKNADFTIITSDNPRFESREKIAKDIESGIKSDNYKIVLDRSAAIKEAIELAETGDVILIAGKGAEDYIDENGTKIPYSDKAEIEKFRRD